MVSLNISSVIYLQERLLHQHHILRHKKWHVWNQDNEDIYTRDENAFMEKVEAEEKQQRMADMETRIQQMKAQRGIKQERTHPIEGMCCSSITILEPTKIPSTSDEKGSVVQAGADVSFSGNKEYEVIQYYLH